MKIWQPKTLQLFLSLIANTLITARKTKHMRQSDLAERVGVSRQTIARLEKGDPTVAIGIYLLAAWILDIPLLSETTEKSKQTTQHAIGEMLRLLQQQLPERISQKSDIDDNF